MKCKTCNEEIDPKMKKALQENKCPYCGDAILDVESMKQFTDLQGIFAVQRFTDSEVHDQKIREKVVRVLMEFTKCIKIKDIAQDDIVQLTPVATALVVPVSPIRSAASPQGPRKVQRAGENAQLISEQQDMRKTIYEEACSEMYGNNGGEGIETSIEDTEAARDVVFSTASNPKVEHLRALAKTNPISRVSE